jgi:hypothetical protein
MKRIFFLSSQCNLRAKCGAWAFVVIGAMLWATSAQAQVESLEPNPLEPAGAGSAGVLEFRGPHSGGAHIGRTPRGQARRVDANRAETTPRDIDGTNHGRRTGNAALRGNARPTAPRSAALRKSASRGEREPVNFHALGDYERGRYAPRGGNQRPPHRAPAARATRPRWY